MDNDDSDNDGRCILYNAGIFTEPFRNMLPKYFFVVLDTW